MLYEVNPTTWFYLSSLMITGIFFKFRRVWSVRNLDLMALICLGPGLLMVANEFYAGYVAILFVMFFLMTRMLCDPMMVRRPLLDVNLSRGGLIFSCASLMLFLVAGLTLTQSRDWSEAQVNASLEQLMMHHLNERILNTEIEQSVQMTPALGDTLATPPKNRIPQLSHGPGMPFFTQMADFPRRWRYERLKAVRIAELQNATTEIKIPEYPACRIHFVIFLATVAQFAIVTAIIMTGWYHFENFNTGIAAATLYLLLPYVSQMPSRLDHLIPAALIMWAVFSWRLPSLAGVLLGFAAALSYYPIFLLPLWFSFYWSRGLYRFLITSLGTTLFLMAIAIPLSGGIGTFISQSGDIFGCIGLFSRGADGFWDIQSHSVFYRIPVIVLYMLMVLFLTFWPSHKNFGTLISSSAALMAGAQFCHPFQGGLYMAWFLPLMILVIFRPNLEDRTASRAVWRRRKIAKPQPTEY